MAPGLDLRPSPERAFPTAVGRGRFTVTETHELISRTETYLRVTAERRLDDSRAFVANDVEFVFPTGVYHSLPEVFAAGEQRYRWIRKKHETWDVAGKEDGTSVVVSAGTLFGENIHGSRFAGIRYLDRITYRGDRIIRQEVWNDLAASGVLDGPDAAWDRAQRDPDEQEER